MRAVKFGVGQSVVRKEDDPLLRGRGLADSASVIVADSIGI
jgi:hypothetical protein